VLTLKKAESVVVEGPYVVGRTADVALSLRRPTQNFMGIFTSGEQMVRVYEGPGTILLNPAPYWRYRIMIERSGQAMAPAESTL
jgi:uncharacterized protein (AIM24 family)